MDECKKKDERLSLRINCEDKKKIQIRAIEMGFKNLTDYVLYCCSREMGESELVSEQIKK